MAENAGGPVVERRSPHSGGGEKISSVEALKEKIRGTRRRLGTSVEVTTSALASMLTGATGANDIYDGRNIASTALRLLRRGRATFAAVDTTVASRIVMAGGVLGAIVLWDLRRRRLRSQAIRSFRTNPLDITNVSAVLFDVDGTLLDSNAAHAESWAQALCEHGVSCEAAQVRPLIGMGADKLLLAIAGIDEASARGRGIANRKKVIFDDRLHRLAPTRGGYELVSYLRTLQKSIVVATSADDREMRTLLQQAGIGDLIPRRTSKDDAGQSKPDPDIVQAALSKARAPAERTVMIGDTPYDIEAARRAGIGTIALRCGGYWSDDEFHGAIAVFDDPAALLAHWQR